VYLLYGVICEEITINVGSLQERERVEKLQSAPRLNSKGKEQHCGVIKMVRR
jgi:hypothetical protein